MKEYTFWDKIRYMLWFSPYGKIEYFFAKRWLNHTFGKHEYWGDYIADLINNDSN